jgi:hypothetical protein
MYSDEISEIALTKFNSLRGAPRASKLGFPNENEYDSLIRGWTRYWNVLQMEKEAVKRRRA